MRLKIRGILSVAFAVMVALAVAACGGSGKTAGETKGAPAASPESSGAKAAEAQNAPQHINLEIRTTEKLNGEEEPRYVPAGATASSLKSWTGNITVKKGQTVVLTIVNHDDGSAPLEGAASQYDKVQGGSETVDGKSASAVQNGQIAHTFTALNLGVNAPIPAAPKGATNKIVYTFKATEAGKFPWQCYTPCGMDAMAALGWMKGTITVLA